MTLEVITPAVENRLTTLETVQFYLSDIFDPEEQEITDLQIDAASRFIENYTHRKFGLETVKERLPSPLSLHNRGGMRLVLERVPVVAMTVVTLGVDGADLTLTETTKDLFIEDPEAGFIWRRSGFNSTAIAGGLLVRRPTRFAHPDWYITYQYGYKLPGETGRDLPEDIELAAILTVKELRLTKDREANVSSESVGDASVTYATNIPGTSILLTREARELLDPYRLTSTGLPT